MITRWSGRTRTQSNLPTSIKHQLLKFRRQKVAKVELPVYNNKAKSLFARSKSARKQHTDVAGNTEHDRLQNFSGRRLQSTHQFFTLDKMPSLSTTYNTRKDWHRQNQYPTLLRADFTLRMLDIWRDFSKQNYTYDFCSCLSFVANWHLGSAKIPTVRDIKAARDKGIQTKLAHN